MGDMPLPRFRRLPHTADVRLAVWGVGESDLLRNAVAGALACALEQAPRGVPARWRRVERWPRTVPGRLVALVNEALFLLYARREVAVTARFGRSGADLGVVPLPRGRTPAAEVKAATFHALRPARGARRSAVLTLDL